VYPVLVRLGSFEITSFGVLVAVGVLLGLLVFRHELRLARLPEDAVDAALVGVIGGLLGAKLLYVLEHVPEEPFLALLLARGGLSWYGGAAGGIGTALVVLLTRRLPLVPVLSAATPALAVGHAVGRIGCFLVGDDYGRPSDLPWAVAFPQGLPPTDVPVHPTQLYELLWLLPLAWVLWRLRRAGVSDRGVLGLYLAGAGLGRFLIEFLRINTRVALGLTVAHWASLAMMAAGVLILIPRRGRRAPDAS